MKYDYDMIVIGGGAAGLTVTSGAAQLGVKVLLIDKEELGGDCLHFGCVPSKSIIKSGKVAQMMREADKYGLEPHNPKIDFAKVTKRIADIIGIVAEHDDPERFRTLGANVVFGEAKFTDDHTVSVELNPKLKHLQEPQFLEHEKSFTVSAKKIVITTGSRANVIPFEGLSDVGYITNEQVFSLKKQPKSMLVIGGGPIGCEMAQSYQRLGTQVKMILRKAHIMDREDNDVALIVEERFKKDGIEIFPSAVIKRFEKVKEGKKVIFEMGEQEHSFVVDEVLIATGRAPVLDLDLEKAGVEYTKRGIPTDKKLRTNKKHIYAAGDANGKYLFTHAAGYEGGIVVSNAVMHFPRKVDYTKIPWTTYTDPEVASCGLNERAAKEAGIKYDVWKHGFTKQDRALAESENLGFVKILTTGKRGKIIGAQIVGPHAGELIHEFIIAINAKLTLATIAGAVHVYPTLAEIAKSAAGKFFSEKLFTTRTRKILRFFFGYRGKI